MKRGALFTLLLLLVCAGIELYLLTVLNEYSYKKQYVEQHSEDIQLLILGHSHVANGINPKLLDIGAFNMSNQGRTTYYDAVLAERYIPQLKNLQYVIWPLGYNFQYSSYRYPCIHRKDVDYASSYKCMYEKDMNISYDISGIYWSELLHSKLNYGRRMFSSSKNFFASGICDTLGFEGLDIAKRNLTWQTEKLPFEVDYKNSNADLALAENLSCMKRIAKVCKDTHVTLIVVSTPCYKTYLELTTPKGLKEMQDCIDSMKSVNPMLEYYNYINDDRFVEEDFFNSCHLSIVGANKFTRIIATECLQR